MSRDSIEVRECDRCKTRVEARSLDAFDGWGTAMAMAQKGGERSGFTDADICPSCFDLLVAWFAQIMHERDAERTYAGRRGPSIKQVAAQLVADNLAQSPEFDAYIAALDQIETLDDLQEYQARNALVLMRWMADLALSQQLQDQHYAAYARLEAIAQGQEAS